MTVASCTAAAAESIKQGGVNQPVTEIRQNTKKQLAVRTHELGVRLLGVVKKELVVLAVAIFGVDHSAHGGHLGFEIGDALASRREREREKMCECVIE